MKVNSTISSWRLICKRMFFAAFLCISMTATQAQILYNEGFDNAAYPPLPTGWAEQNLGSTAAGAVFPGWIAGGGVFASHGGAGFLGGSYNTITGTGTISLWLFAPTVTLKNGDILSFWTRTTDGTYPDRLQVRMSTNGSSVNAGANSTTVGDFTTQLLEINPGQTSTGYPVVWTQYNLTLSGLPAGGVSGRIAFRYYVTNGGPSGSYSDFIGIDDVSYTTFPGACSGAPALGNTQASVASACPNVAFNLSVSTPPATSGITYQWQSSATGAAGSYTNIAGATSATYVVPNQTVTTYYQLVATCGANSGTSTPLMVPESTTCYCIPGATNCNAGDQITNVTVGGINNTTSTCAAGPPAGYSNYLALPAGQLFRGAANPASVTVTNGGTEYAGIWVDYNQNGIWEASEYQFMGSGPGGTFTQNLNVPAGALLGNTRMRVRVKYNTNIVAGTDQCSAYTYGETEDYTVNIQDCIPVTVTTQPAAQTATCGGSASYNAAFAGSLPGGYQWEVQTTPGGIWTNLTNAAPYSGVTTTTLTINPVATSMNGYNYRLVYSGACTGTSFTNAAALTVNAIPATVTQTPATLCGGGTTSQTITVTGGGTGVFSPNAGLFTDAAHTIAYTGTAVTTVYAFPAATTTYSLVRTNGACVSNPTNVTVTVNAPIAGTPVLPAATAICANAAGSINFTGITGGAALTYQWQVNTLAAPATFTNVTNGGVYSGATTATLTITNPTAAMTGLQYKVIISSASCGTNVTSNATTLTVNPVPVVVISASPANAVASPTSPVTFTAAVSSATSPITYQWYLNTNLVPGATGAAFTPDVNAVGDYSVRVVDANGCGTATSTPLSITMTRGASDIAFIYPSPNSGVFQVRFYNATANSIATQGATVNVYDQKGSRVYTQNYVVNGPYTRMNVDMGTHARGIYRVEVTDASGNRLKTGSVMIF